MRQKSNWNTDIALRPNGEDGCQVLGIRTAFLELDLCVMLNGMRVCENPPSTHDEPAAARAILPLPLPRQREIRLCMDAEDLYHRVHRRHHLHRALPLRYQRRLRRCRTIPVRISQPRAAALRRSHLDLFGAAAAALLGIWVVGFNGFGGSGVGGGWKRNGVVYEGGAVVLRRGFFFSFGLGLSATFSCFAHVFPRVKDWRRKKKKGLLGRRDFQGI